MPLRPRQLRFVDEYLIDLNATQAAIRSGYSPKTAYSIGGENLKKPEIAAKIAEKQQERAEKTEITKDWISDQLKLNYRRAMQSGDGSVANRSLELMGKLHGHFVEKSEVSFPNVKDLSDDEIERRRKALKIA